MKLEKIISFANKHTEIRFQAMVRSLRATGCNLPIWVIPFDDNTFPLPPNCFWWEMPEVLQLLAENKLHNMKRKFQCFLTENYQYVDADVIFLRNPEEILGDLRGFVTSCCHWNNPEHTFVQSTIEVFKAKSTTWQKKVFNSGQFASDQKLFSLSQLETLIKAPESAEALSTHDQISINLFVFHSLVNVTNVTLPPFNMESTWAGDYVDADYQKYWQQEETKPYLIHWAGCKMDFNRPIDHLFMGFLTATERKEVAKNLELEIKQNKITLLSRLSRKLKQTIKKMLLR